MRHVHINAPRMAIAFLDNHHFLRRLDEEEWPTCKPGCRYAGLFARRTRRESDLAVQDLVIVLFHDVLGPLLQIWVRQIRNAIGRLLSGADRDAIADVGMAGSLAMSDGEPGTGM